MKNDRQRPVSESQLEYAVKESFSTLQLVTFHHVSTGSCIFVVEER